jgi:hypothetical protein
MEAAANEAIQTLHEATKATIANLINKARQLQTEPQQNLELNLQNAILKQTESECRSKDYLKKIEALTTECRNLQTRIIQLEKTSDEATISLNLLKDEKELTTQLRTQNDQLKDTRSKTQLALQIAQSETEASKKELEVRIQQLRLEIENENESKNKNLIGKLIDLQSENDRKCSIISTLEKQGLRSVLPSHQGNEGELEIQTLLQRTFGCFMTVKNVSKGGHGHELDLELISRDDEIRIRIDVKNSTGAYLPEHEITRFYTDIDGLSRLTPAPTAGILFLRPGLRTPLGTFSIASKRGTTLTYQIGWWMTDLLCETIHEIIIQTRHNLALKKSEVKSVAGELEIQNAISGLCDTIGFQNQQITKQCTSFTELKNLSAVKNRKVAEQLRSAHSKNPCLISQEVLIAFESQIPKRSRGKPPQDKTKKRKPKPVSSSSDSDSPIRKRKK